MRNASLHLCVNKTRKLTKNSFALSLSLFFRASDLKLGSFVNKNCPHLTMVNCIDSLLKLKKNKINELLLVLARVCMYFFDFFLLKIELKLTFKVSG